MEASKSITTEPMQAREKRLFDRIDSTLGEYAIYLEQDHRRAVESAEWEEERITSDQNGDEKLA
jgi:hypothetical protein